MTGFDLPGMPRIDITLRVQVPNIWLVISVLVILVQVLAKHLAIGYLDLRD